MRLRSRGTDPEVERFSAALRRLDEEAFAAFVAAVWEARGRSATRNGTTLSVETRGESGRLRVTHGEPTPGRDGRATRVVTSRLVPESTADAPEPTVVDAAELLRVVRYAVERDRATSLLARHLGRGAEKFAEPGAVRAERERVLSRRRRLGRRFAAAVALAACLAAVALVGPGLVSSFDAPPFGSAENGATPTGTGVETATDPAAVEGGPTASRLGGRTDYAALGCPSPPDDADPEELTPSVVPGASASGLDGWRLLDSERIESFDGRVDLGDHPEPAVRYTARYVPPSGETLRLTVDRWRSVAAAEAVTSSLAGTNQTVLRWGRYTVVVRAFTADGVRLSRAQTLDRSRVLLASVRDPSGSRLGFRCVASLLDEANASATSDPAENDGDADPPPAPADAA
ncbi:hypothetical protein [Halopelagius longus]|uniref:Uncharacterized protein n=1 Tax=Halopelagius longus TaxID=1236180 RepID=A0A1H1FFK3_9EURY|nr:hypothetical protein [Halopelagius longus]RDI70122.1 hypothetical protein DWB78_15980 [Halopelagius longus]SDQ99782.1 hypothetical protein SAMN05216278_3189 [Halopelagius longus]